MQAARGASLNDGELDTQHRRVWWIFAAVAVVVYLLDQVTKVIAVRELSGRGSVEVVGDFFQFTLVRNPGAAFNTGTSFTVALTFFAVTAAVVVVYLSNRLGDRVWAVGLGVLLGGILGNLTDRIVREPEALRGHVVDFLHVTNWPVFNVADMAINLAAVVIVVQTLRGVTLRGVKLGKPEASAT